MAGKQNPRSFGAIKRKGQPGAYRYFPSYVGPDRERHTPGRGMPTKAEAETWLEEERKRTQRPDWCPPKQWAALEAARLERLALEAAEHPFADVARRYMRSREHGPKPLKPRTVEHYEKLLDQLLLPTFATTPVKTITPELVEDWYYGRAEAATPTYTAHAYSLLSTVMKYAVSKGYASMNPCMITGASNVKREHEIKPASHDELDTLVAAMPGKYRLMVLLAAWCGLRFGELAELRRGDVDVKAGTLAIKRGVVVVKGRQVVGGPKTRAGERTVFIPPHLLPLVREHLAANMSGRDGLLFPATDGGNLRPSTFYRVYYPARDKAGRPDLRLHDLRHTGATMLAQEGATIRELQAALGHSTHNAAMRYQHATTERAEELAKRLSARVAQ